MRVPSIVLALALLAAGPSSALDARAGTKSPTLALAGRLVDRGELDLVAPVERYLPVHQPGGGPGISALVGDRDARVVVAVLSNETSANVGGKAFDAVLEAFLATQQSSASPSCRRPVSC